MTDSAPTDDINDVFDNLVMSEDRQSQQGYQEGFSKGRSEENIEAYHLGYHRGAEVGAELGYYLGIINTYAENEDEMIYNAVKDKSLIHDINKLEIDITNFPTTNSNIFDINEGLESIRALFKKICSRLKLNCKHFKTDALSF